MVEQQREIYDFTLEEMKRFKDKQGIYGIVYRGEEETEVIYVGQSTNLAHRLQHHRNENAFNQTLNLIIKEDGRCNRCKALAMYDFIANNRDDIGFIILEETEDLKYWEEHYIALFKPRYNYLGVDVPFRK